jgi:CO/xanthine dehydrogenase FAD-binding subunit
MITIQKYVRPENLEEAWQLNQNRRNRIAGGMLWTKMSRGSAGTLIDLCALGLDTVDETEEEFSIGAMVSLRQLELHKGLNAYTSGMIRDAVQDIVGVQFRNLATVGGSIWGRFGFSDVLTAFQAMDTYVELYKGGVIPLEEFAKMPYDRDLLVRLIVKKTPGRFVYASVRNQRTDFPTLTCALSEMNGEIRCAIGARPARAAVIRDENGILAGGIDAASAKTFGEYAASVLHTGSNVRAGADYRTHLIRVLTERNLLRLGGLNHGN